MQVNGASGAENAFTVDGIVTNSLVNGAVAPEHRVRVPAGSAGQDQRHLRRVRRRARRRRQRRDQERRQHVPRRGALLLRGQRARGRPGEAAGARPGDRGQRVLRAGRGAAANDSNEFGGSLGGPIVRDRLFFYGAYSPRNEQTHQRPTTSPTAPTATSSATSGASRRSAS